MSFSEAFRYTMSTEGGYTDDPIDTGGETYMGISRTHHPDWVGWDIIDKYKRNNIVPLDKALRSDQKLQSDVESFYYNTFWLPLSGDDLPREIAIELFDTAVNMGKPTAIKILQKSLNLLNRNGKLFDDLKVDGVLGSKTKQAISKVDSRRLLKVMNGYQFLKYANLMENHPEYEKYVGWFNRI